MVKKSVLVSTIILILVVGLFVLTGCDNNENINSLSTNNLESTETNNIENTNNMSNNEESINSKEEFNKTVFLDEFNIEYKLPSNSTSEYDFEDMGCSIILDVSEHETDDAILHINDSKAKTIETTNINGYSYEHYKYSNDEDNVTYIYRTQVNGKYYAFDYNVYGLDYDDTQVEKFISTVVFK